MVFAMQKNSIFFENFRDVIQRLFESGIFLQIPGLSAYTKTGGFEKDLFASSFRPYERKGTNVVLSWNYLYAGFAVWAVVVVVSVLVFIGELIVSNKELLKKKFNQKLEKIRHCSSEIVKRLRKFYRDMKNTSKDSKVHPRSQKLDKLQNQ